MTTSTDYSFRVTRDRAGVVVTVDGDLGLGGSVRLGAVLADLIDGQGNLAVSVDLTELSSVDTRALGVFAVGASLARRRGGTLSVVWPGEGAAAFETTLAPSVEGHRHLVEFYEREGSLADSVRHYVEPALREDEAVIVVATRSHRDLFEAALLGAGVDVEGARAGARYLDVDAEATLSRFMVDGTPDPTRFHTSIGGLVRRWPRGRPVRVYGEMVAVLWAEGNAAAAVALEDLWNELARSEPFSLLCAYPATAFDPAATSGLFRTICEQHSPVVKPRSTPPPPVGQDPEMPLR